MKAEQLSNQYFELIDDCHEYYRKFTSQQKEDIVVEEDEYYYVDYLGSKGTYNEATLVRLCKDYIVVNDRDLGEEREVYFSDVTTSDKLQILEIYEENNFKQLS